MQLQLKDGNSIASVMGLDDKRMDEMIFQLWPAYQGWQQGKTTLRDLLISAKQICETDEETAGMLLMLGGLMKTAMQKMELLSAGVPIDKIIAMAESMKPGKVKPG